MREKHSLDRGGPRNGAYLRRGAGDGGRGGCTTVPDVQACTTEGSGFFMTVQASTGGRTRFAAFDLNGDRQYTAPGDTITLPDGSVAVASGVAVKGGAPGAALYLNDTSQLGDTVVLGNSDNSREQIDLYSGGREDGRRTWREIRR